MAERNVFSFLFELLEGGTLENVNGIFFPVLADVLRGCDACNQKDVHSRR